MKTSVAILLLGAAGCASAPPKSDAPQVIAPTIVERSETPPPEAAADPIERIERATLRREAAPILALASSADASVRAAVARGLGRLQRPADAPVIAALLGDADPAVRSAAAEGAGLIALSWEPLPEEALAVLDRAAAKAAGSESTRSIAWSMGRIGGPESARALLELLGTEDPAVRAEAARSVGLIARFRTLPDRAGASRALAALADDRSPEVRGALAFALIWLEDPAREELAAALARDGDPQVRAWAARAVGEVASTPSLLEALAGDPVATVRVEAVRGLQSGARRAATAGRKGHRDLAMEEAFEEALQRTAGALAREAAAGKGAIATAPLLLLVRPGATPVPAAAARAAYDGIGDPLAAPEKARADLALLRCHAAAALDRASGAIATLPGCGGELVPAGLVEKLEAESLKELAGGVERLLVLARSGDAAVRAAAVDALAAKEDGKAARAVVAALADSDGAVVATAAEALASRPKPQPGPELRDALAKALRRFASDGDAETAQSLLAALAAGAAKDEEARGTIALARLDPRPSVRARAMALLASLPGEKPAPVEAGPTRAIQVPDAAATGDAPVILETDRGPVTIALDPKAAPVASANFQALVEAGFYDGLRIHRVEPGFVVQGGDPRGDGFGGPGYSMPCENGVTPYLRGTVGMALSGKDTGGSQFFVTLARSPHLEGRYTAFGIVVEGMEVVDRLLPGDRIRHARMADR